jgi:NTP pyrophosphatase (non-canonical NTP hydrolase)
VKGIANGKRICLSKIPEILDILQEECAEVIVAVSKIRRFGIDNTYKEGGTQREHLIQELGDVVAMIYLLTEHGVLTEQDLKNASDIKFNKLKKWSTIYE